MNIKTAKLISDYISHKFEKKTTSIQNGLSLSLFKSKWRFLLTRFSHLSLGTSFDNKVTLFDCDDKGLQIMWDDIDKAKERVWCETFIFDNSNIAMEFASRFRSAAKRGCNVALHYDWLGSLASARNPSFDLLEKSGVKTVPFNKYLPPSKAMGPLFFRNHRKLLIVDDKAFVGSMNISKDSGGPHYGKGHYYDVQCKVEGPAVEHLAQSFWRNMCKEDPPINKTLSKFDGGAMIQVFESNPRKRNWAIQKIIREVVAMASKSIDLTTSYFHPSLSVRAALRLPLQRKVPVNILLSGNSGVLGDQRATSHILKEFFKHKTRPNVHFLKDRHCHAKQIVVDDVWSFIGSYNWDRISDRRNLEVGIGVLCPKFAQEMKKKQLEKISQKDTETATPDQWTNQSIVSKFFDFLSYKIFRLTGHQIVDGMEPLD